MDAADRSALEGFTEWPFVDRLAQYPQRYLVREHVHQIHAVAHGPDVSDNPIVKQPEKVVLRTNHGCNNEQGHGKFDQQ